MSGHNLLGQDTISDRARLTPWHGMEVSYSEQEMQFGQVKMSAGAHLKDAHATASCKRQQSTVNSVDAATAKSLDFLVNCQLDSGRVSDRVRRDWKTKAVPKIEPIQFQSMLRKIRFEYAQKSITA